MENLRELRNVKNVNDRFHYIKHCEQGNKVPLTTFEYENNAAYC